MKVLIFINSLGAGGAERSMVELARFLKRENVIVKFVCFERREVGLEKEVMAMGVETLYLDRAKKGFINQVNFALTCIRKEKPDIIHSVLAKSNLILRASRLFVREGVLIQSLVNTPYSLERKKDGRLSWQKFWIMKQIDKYSARLTKNIFYHSITNEVLKHYRPLFKITENYQIVYRGRNPNTFLHKSKSPNFTIINSGRQEFAKGQIDILKALVYIEKKYGVKDIKLEILGREGSYSKVLKDFISQNELEERVFIYGFVNNVEERLAISHVFIFPSYYEGLGGALVEAFAAQLPCICSDLPVLREVVGDNSGALFCAPGDYKCLAEKILKLYNDKNLRNSLSKYSYARFKEVFQLDEINQQMLDMYQSLRKA
jgi:glycosyltransferase involved in cell wall biosynthesis